MHDKNSNITLKKPVLPYKKTLYRMGSKTPGTATVKKATKPNPTKIPQSSKQETKPNQTKETKTENNNNNNKQYLDEKYIQMC